VSSKLNIRGRVTADTGVPVAVVAKVITTYLHTISDELARGHSVQLTGVAKLEPYTKKPTRFARAGAVRTVGARTHVRMKLSRKLLKRIRAHDRI